MIQINFGKLLTWQTGIYFIGKQPDRDQGKNKAPFFLYR